MTRWWKIEYLDGKFRVRLVFWHPGLWLEVFRTMREAGCSVVGSVYYSAKLIFMLAKAK